MRTEEGQQDTKPAGALLGMLLVVVTELLYCSTKIQTCASAAQIGSTSIRLWKSPPCSTLRLLFRTGMHAFHLVDWISWLPKPINSLQQEKGSRESELSNCS
jgi:hypothetical protein